MRATKTARSKLELIVIIRFEAMLFELGALLYKTCSEVLKIEECQTI